MPPIGAVPAARRTASLPPTTADCRLAAAPAPRATAPRACYSISLPAIALAPAMRLLIRPDYGDRCPEEERIHDEEMCGVIMVSGCNMGSGGAPPKSKTKTNETEGEASLGGDLKLAANAAQDDDLRAAGQQAGVDSAALAEQAGAQMSNMAEQAGKGGGD